MERAYTTRILTSAFVLGLTATLACGSTKRSAFKDGTEPGADPALPGGGDGDNRPPDGDFGPPTTPPDPSQEDTRDPLNCEEAATKKSYVGCDYWPTITPNPVWSTFDYAVVVANTGTAEANVTVTGPKGTNKSVTVPAGELKKIYLPWNEELKGRDFDECTATLPTRASVLSTGGAYHLVSSSPVIVYQFNALEYKGEGGESPEGGPKDWSSCPGTTTGCRPANGGIAVKQGCFSFSNDASLLLPSTAMTNNYRVLAHSGTSVGIEGRIGIVPTALSITATQPDTQVTVTLAEAATIVASESEIVPATEGGQVITLTLAGGGDVAQLVTELGQQYDFSGSLVQSNKPVQVIASVPCISIPSDRPACDHIEETVLPAETLGRHYVVTSPTGPKGDAVRQKVRLYGNKDGTTLTYQPSKPANCPDTLAAGQMADCGLVGESFEVTANNEFGVATFLLGATEYDPTGEDRRGDPDQSTFAGVEQFRTKYVFLAPTDYPVLYADVAATEDAELELDGERVTAPWTKIGEGPFGVYRLDLTQSGKDGAHTLLAKKPVGVQVIGFGDNTSFQYPAGLNLKIISPPPSVPK
ncbi:MAG TPA: IgGFc-binding protein [Labilithrix sp.]|nr:IgGFc-binding protein [Labilithrix sp.]